jgi:hypothetical protein
MAQTLLLFPAAMISPDSRDWHQVLGMLGLAGEAAIKRR